MPATPRSSATDIPLLMGALAYGTFLYCLLPSGITLLNDDFAYYRSVVETLQHHQPWADDFLEPWAAGLSLLAAGAFRLTGSFIAATQGWLVLFGIAGFWAFGQLLRERGVSTGKALGISFFVLTFPLLQQTSVEFGSWALHVPCLLLALLAAERRRWVLFAVAWLPALATRQTAVVWGLLPLFAVLSGWRRRNEAGSSSSWIVPGAVLGVAALLFGALALTMNSTQAYEHLSKPQLLAFVRSVLHGQGLGAPMERVTIGGAVFILAAGLGGWARGNNWGRSGRSKLWPLLTGAAAFAALIGLRAFINYAPFGYDGSGAAGYLLIVGAIAVAGLTGVGDTRWSAPIVLMALAGSVAICAHTPLNAPYLLETGLLGFFAVRPIVPPTSARTPTLPVRRLHWVPLAAGGTLLLANLLWAYDLKLHVDLRAARIRVTERALRDGSLAIGDVPAGVETLVYWRTLPYLYAHPESGLVPRTLLPLLRTPGAPAAFVQQLPPVLSGWPSLGDTRKESDLNTLRRECIRLGWFFRGEVALVRPSVATTAAAVPAAPSDYHPQSFPLTDAEWGELIGREGSGDHSREGAHSTPR